MPEQIWIKRFKCVFCKKHYKSKYSARKHEVDCFYNPLAKACATCAYFVVDNMGTEFCEAGVNNEPFDDYRDMDVRYSNRIHWIKHCHTHILHESEDPQLTLFNEKE